MESSVDRCDFLLLCQNEAVTAGLYSLACKPCILDLKRIILQFIYSVTLDSLWRCIMLRLAMAGSRGGRMLWSAVGQRLSGLGADRKPASVRVCSEC